MDYFLIIIFEAFGIFFMMGKQIAVLKKANPTKTFIPAPPDNNCACNDCPHMKRNTLEKLYLCMEYEVPEITMEEELRLAAKKPIERMLEISKKAGL